MTISITLCKPFFIAVVNYISRDRNMFRMTKNNDQKVIVHLLGTLYTLPSTSDRCRNALCRNKLVVWSVNSMFNQRLVILCDFVSTN